MRLYLPTLAELIDRLSVVRLESIFIPENKEKYEEEITLIKHDIQELGQDSELIHAVMMVMLSNRFIWENESKARLGGPEQDKLLKLTHSINGVRNRYKNVISSKVGERVDLKVDCLASDLPKEYGNWNV